MHRRDFLLLRTTPRARVFELPCQRLYMQYLDICRPPAAESDTALPDHWFGEPEAVYEPRSARDLFDALASELEGADLLRVIDRSWLGDDELKREVEQLIDRFRTRGGRVEFVGTPPESSRPTT